MRRRHTIRCREAAHIGETFWSSSVQHVTPLGFSLYEARQSLSHEAYYVEGCQRCSYFRIESTCCAAQEAWRLEFVRGPFCIKYGYHILRPSSQLLPPIYQYLTFPSSSQRWRLYVVCYFFVASQLECIESNFELLQQYRLHRIHTVILCCWYYSIAVFTTLPMPNLLYASSVHDWSVGGTSLPLGSKL